MSQQFEIRAEGVMQKINELAAISDEPDILTRSYGTKAFQQAAQLIFSWMIKAGLNTRIDNIGNIRGRLTCRDACAKTLVIGSHIDTVINAGKFDGPLGVIMAIDLVDSLVKSKINLPFNIEVIAFCDEEGVRFHSTYLGSKVVAGTFERSILQKKDTTGTSLEQVIAQLGGDHNQLIADHIAFDEWLGYVEIHIEQGPVLYENNIPVAVVTGIAGQHRAELEFEGVAGHAGTVPMAMRNDALCCAAECMLAIERWAAAHPGLVATVGKIDIPNAATNVIPGLVSCSIDIRNADNDALQEACEQIEQVCGGIASRRNIGFKMTTVQQTDAVRCHPALTACLHDAISNAGIPVVKLVSGAGHDAVPIAAIAPVSILFVRCFKGISHNPLENVELKDIAAAIQVAEGFIQSLINKHPVH